MPGCKRRCSGKHNRRCSAALTDLRTFLRWLVMVIGLSTVGYPRMVEAARAVSWHDGSGLRKRGEPDAGERTDSGSGARDWVVAAPIQADPDRFAARAATRTDDLSVLSRRGH